MVKIQAKKLRWAGPQSAISCLWWEHSQAVTTGPFLGVFRVQQCQHAAQVHGCIASPFNRLCT